MALFDKFKEKITNKNTIAFNTKPINFNKFDKIDTEDTQYGVGFCVLLNDGVNICAEACACCWDTKIPSSYEDKAEYIAKRTRIGHGSVTEHSNVVFYLNIKDEHLIDLSEFLSKCRFVHTVYKHSDKYNQGYLVIGGSWRAFSDILKMFTANELNDNYIIKSLMPSIYTYINRCGMEDIVKQGIIPDQFENLIRPTDPNGFKRTAIFNNSIDILNFDSFDILLDNIKTYCPEPELFSLYDLLDMGTVTVLYKDMSRIITQQLTRHRNAITQESQRYVNYSSGGFNSPAKFKSKYDADYEYSIQFGRSSQKFTLQSLGDAIAKIYGQLVDEKRTNGHNLQFEDARAYLPNNIKCGKIYITFTWRTFFMYLFLREDIHAQVEMRQFALELGKWFRETFPQYSDLYDALKPLPINNSKYAEPIATVSNNEIISNDASEVISTEEVFEKLEEQIGYQEKGEVNNEEN